MLAFITPSNTSCIPGVLWLCLSNSIRQLACIRNSWICTLHLCGFTILVNYIQRPLISSEMSFSTVPMNKFLPLYNIFTGSPFSVTQEITRGGGEGGVFVAKQPKANSINYFGVCHTCFIGRYPGWYYPQGATILGSSGRSRGTIFYDVIHVQAFNL